ncbi:MAG: porphobilinogen deaminase, partial [Deltaproteobacteria bacterium]|nr:porphobilinogen deaminase [Deltaproteobacteria bacterium]
MMKRTWIVGTRGSKLALTQTRIVIDALKQANPGHNFEIRIIKTTGDTVWD